MSRLNTVLIIALVVIPAVFGAFKMPAEMGLAIASIGLALCFANLEKFSRFKGAGFEAELRTAVAKTYAAIDQLKELSLVLSAPIVDGLALSGRMLQYLHLKYKLEHVEKISSTLQKLEASESEIKDVCATMFQRVRSDHIKAALLCLKKANKDKSAVFDGCEDWDIHDWDKDKLEAFIHEHALDKNEEVIEWIRDLDYFEQTKKLRREDKWQS
jgi:Sec7-like guanine-nucleotide exchange factor